MLVNWNLYWSGTLAYSRYTFIYLYYFHRLISAARDLRLGNPDSKGTIFLLDSTATPGDKFAYQQVSYFHL